ncbi:MAG: ArnT family glycosyltransferase [Fimbriimonadaceae bacterium]
MGDYKGSNPSAERGPGPDKFQFGFLLALCLLVVVGSLTYATITPYREAGIINRTVQPDYGAPDERQHANYVQHILDGEGVPVFQPGSPDLYETYQAHQPPLYYFLTAAFANIVGVDSVQELAGSRLRWLNALLAALTTAGIFFGLFWGTRNAWTGLAGAAATSLLPMFLALHGAVSNDPLLIAICTWTLALTVKAVREGWSVPLAIAIGSLAGLGSLTKTSAIALVPVILLAFWISSSKLNWKVVAATVAPYLVLSVPWWARNQNLYGDPLAVGAFNEAFAGSPKAQVFIQELGHMDYWFGWVGWWTTRSFLGVFGYMDIFLPDAVYRIFAVLAIVALAVWGFRMFKGTAAGIDAETQRTHLLYGVFLLIIILLFIRFNSEYFQGQARYLYPAIASIALIFGTALSWKRPKIAILTVTLALIGINIFAIDYASIQFERRKALSMASHPSVTFSGYSSVQTCTDGCCGDYVQLWHGLGR